jgi:hypothetical protein
MGDESSDEDSGEEHELDTTHPAGSLEAIKAYLDRFQDIMEELDELELEHNLVASHEHFFEHINAADHCGWDFSKRPMHVLFDSGSGDFFSAFLNLESAKDANGVTRLDQCPIYILDLETPNRPFFVEGNFRSYMTTLLTCYLESDEARKPNKAKRALVELEKGFSDVLLAPEVPLASADFGF